MKIKEARNNYGHKGPFWYFTTHGVQPGSIPKGVHVLEIRDGRNDKGTMGTFVALDGVLTYDELREYDMKEMSPKINEGFEVTPQLVRELVDEYRSEAYGFNGIKDYVEAQYPRHPEEFKKELIKKMKKAMNESLKEDTADSKINKGLREGLYDIYYDYEDEEGYVWRDNKEEFEGDWLELRDYINSMRRNGCYNIDAVYREGSSDEYDYELEVIGEGCKRKIVKEDIADNDIDRVYKKLSKLNGVDFGKLEDEYLRTRPSVKDAVYKFYGTVLNMKSYCKDFVNWVKEKKGIDLKGIPCKKNEWLKEDTVKQGNYWVNKGKEGTHGKFKTKKAADAQRKAMFAQGFKESKEGMNKKDIAKKLVQLAYDYDYYDFMDSLEVGETMEDAIVRTERDLDNPKYVRGIIRWLKEVANDEFPERDDFSQRAKRLIKELRGER